MMGDAEGKIDELKGRAKQAAGDLTDNEELKGEGVVDETAGKAKQKVEQGKEKLEDGIDRVKDKVQGDR
jgi:uncharacterized protein YjbJ (UPF0337 family)